MLLLRQKSNFGPDQTLITTFIDWALELFYINLVIQRNDDLDWIRFAYQD